MKFSRFFLSLSLISALVCVEQVSATQVLDALEHNSEREAFVSLADKKICGAIEEVVKTVTPALACEMNFTISGESAEYRWDELSKEDAILFFRQLSLRHNVSHIKDPKKAEMAIDYIYDFYVNAFQSNNVALFRMHVDFGLDGNKEPLIKLEKKDLHRCKDGPDQNGPAQFFYDVSSPLYSDRTSIKPKVSHGRLAIVDGVTYFISWYDFPESLVVTRAKLTSGSGDGEVRFTTICSYLFDMGNGSE